MRAFGAIDLHRGKASHYSGRVFECATVAGVALIGNNTSIAAHGSKGCASSRRAHRISQKIYYRLCPRKVRDNLDALDLLTLTGEDSSNLASASAPKNHRFQGLSNLRAWVVFRTFGFAPVHNFIVCPVEMLVKFKQSVQDFIF